MSTEPIESILKRLRAGQTVDEDLPGGGRLHIDRPLPFLCVYRRPADVAQADTEALLTTQSGWLIAPVSQDVGDLICALADYHQQAFGAYLVLEIWSGAEQQEELPPPVFRIVAPDHQAPDKLLETMETALLRVTIHRKTPVISVAYQASVHPPSLPPLLSAEQQARCGCICLGLEINPVYRDPQSGKTFTFAHREFRKRLNRALKRSFYAFVHQYTRHRPAHYHELGPRVIAPPVTQVDAALASLSEGFDLLLHVTPVNSEQAWQEFRQHRYQRPVEFLYRPRTIDPAQMKRQLYAIPLENIDDPTLADLFAAKREELDRQITLVADRNMPRFLLGSRQLFGDVEPELLQLAEEILAQALPAQADADREPMLDARQFAERAEVELDWYRQQDAGFSCRVEVRDDIAGIMVSHGNFLIGSAATVAGSRVDAALAHEIGTHALTYHNGRQQPFQELYCGMAGYEPLQEGLAVLSEYLSGQLGVGRVRQLAGRVLAVKLISDGAEFLETFRILHRERGFTARAAFMITMRTYRGGGYTKDAVYLRGLMQLLDYLAEGHELETLYLGKVAHDHLGLIEELRWRQILKPPRLLPRLFQLPEVVARCARLKQGLKVTDLLQEVA